MKVVHDDDFLVRQHTPDFLIHDFFTDRKSSIWGVWAAPGGRETLQKGGERSPPPFGKVSRPPGAAQTPQIDDFRPVKKSYIRNPGVGPSARPDVGFLVFAHRSSNGNKQQQQATTTNDNQGGGSKPLQKTQARPASFRRVCLPGLTPLQVPRAPPLEVTSVVGCATFMLRKPAAWTPWTSCRGASPAACRRVVVGVADPRLRSVIVANPTMEVTSRGGACGPCRGVHPFVFVRLLVFAVVTPFATPPSQQTTNNTTT